MTNSENIAENLQAVRAALQAAAGPDRAPPQLVAVSKTHPVEAILDAWAAGQRVFAENRVQEAQAKFPAVRAAHPELALHLIGPLQTNKAEDAVALFDVIESLDREKLVDALARAMTKLGRRPRLFIQVNTGEEPQKAGVAPDGLAALLDYARAQGLAVAGLMCIPPADEDPAPHFMLLHKLADRHGLAERSMGMSGDYQTAARLGATEVRVGTAIFGPRGTFAPH